MNPAKTATTAVPLSPLLARRWSTRAFDGEHLLTDHQVTALLEAARWAPSAGNTQPWRFAVAHRGSAEHAAILDTLAGGNRAWAHAASALVVVAIRPTPENMRPWAHYDAGQAAAHLTVQAEHEGLAVHQMGGFDAARLADLLGAEDVTPLVVVAVGRYADRGQLAEPFAGRELATRERLPLQELLLRVRADEAAADDADDAAA